jgi:hypothetical protein
LPQVPGRRSGMMLFSVGDSVTYMVHDLRNE